jgi:plasmid stability protein
MAILTIEDLPDELLRQLRDQAAQRQKSLSQQALYVLRQGIEREQASSVDAEVQAHQWEQLAGRWKSGQSIEEEISNLYAARSAGREVRL